MEEGTLPGPSREQLASILEAQIRGGLSQVASAGVPAWMVMRPNRFYAAHIKTPGGGWAIQNESLKTAAFVSAGLAACAAYGTSGPGLKDLLSAGLALVALVWQARHYGATLDELQIRTLAALKATPEERPSGWSAAELCDRLNAMTPDAVQPWTVADVEEGLRSLSKVRLSNGKVAAFAVQASDDLWSANGV